MKTIKIKFVDFWDEFIPEESLILSVLKQHFSVEIVDDINEADYLFISLFAHPYEFCKYDKIRILFSGENYIPDFNLVDYSICPYPIEFLDRCVYKPVCFDDTGRFLYLQNKNRNYDISILNEKIYFANFIASHESENNIRGDFFKKLCGYKRVESPGTYLNNMDTPIKLSYIDNTKTDFQKKCKFTLCFESTKHEGFITEKITDAFYADTIPVYYGSSTVSDIFNPKAFINCADFSDFDEAIKKVIEIDQDDDKYLEMLRQPIFTNPDIPKNIYNNFEKQLVHIFEQPIEVARRRSNVYWPQKYENYLLKNEPILYYEAVRIHKEYIEYLQSPKQKNKKSIRKLRKELRMILKSDRFLFPFNSANKHYYDIAYPKTMYVYWTCKGIANKLSRFFGAK